MSELEINSPDTGISSQLASVDNHEWYHSETDKAPIAKKSECLQVPKKSYWFILLYAGTDNSNVSQFSTNQQVAEGMGKFFFWAFFYRGK